MENNIRIFLVSFWMNIPYYLLCCVPFFPKLRVKKRTLIFMIVATTLCVSAYYVLRVSFLPDSRGLDQIAITCFYVIYMIEYIFCFRISLPKLLYIFLVVQAYSNIINITSKYIDVKLFPADKDIIGTWPYGCFALVMTIITFPVVFRFFGKQIQEAIDQLENKNFWILCTTPVLFLIVNMVFMWVFVENIGDGKIFFLYLTVLLTGFLTYFITFRTIVDSTKRVRLESDMRNMEQQLKFQVRNYSQLAENIKETRAVRHDLRHHLTVLTGYLEAGNEEGLKKYLADYLRELPDDNEPSVSRNYAVDTIVRYYIARVRKAGADIDIKIVVPQKIRIPDSELCIIFGNLFENAANSVEAQESGKKFLYSRCTFENRKLVLILDNSVGEGKPGKPGIGQASVKAVAERYGGGVRFGLEDGVYKSSVLLLEPGEEGKMEFDAGIGRG